MRKPDPVALVAGLAIALYGGLLLLDNLDVVELRFGDIVPLSCALVGAILLVSGLSRSG